MYYHEAQSSLAKWWKSIISNTFGKLLEEVKKNHLFLPIKKPFGSRVDTKNDFNDDPEGLR